MRLRFIIGFLLACVSLHAWGSDLAVPAEQPKEDTAQVNLLNRLAMSIRESDHELAAKYAQSALELSNKLGYLKGKAAALGNLGWVCYRKTDFVGTLQYSIEAMKISEQIGDKAEMARSMNNIAAVSYEQKQYDKAITDFRYALQYAYESNEPRVISRSLNNLGYIYFNSNRNLDSAEYFATKGVEISERNKDNYLMAFGLRTLGDVHAQRHSYQAALKLYQRALALADASRNNSMRAATNHRIAKVYVALGRNNDAIDILIRNADESRKKNYPEELERTYKVLAEIYHHTGNPSKAYEYLDRYTALHDTIYSMQNGKQIALMQNEYDLSLKQAEIELLTKDTDLQAKELSTRKAQLYATILGASCVLLLVIVMLYSYSKVKRANRQLEQQKAELARKNLEVEEKSNALELLNTTKDKLFSIIGHDFRSPLHSLRGLLELIGTRSMGQEEFQYYSRDLRNKIDAVYSNLDNLLHWSVSQLNGIIATPVNVNVRNLTVEVMELYEEIARVKKVKLTNHVESGIQVWADKDHVRLVIRNLVSNALKFTSADGHVIVAASVDRDLARISVKDTGVGIAGEDIQRLFVKQTLWSAKGTNNEKGLGLGLLLCKEFVEKNHGSIDIHSVEGVGTTITFTLPLYHEYGADVRGFEFAPSSFQSN